MAVRMTFSLVPVFAENIVRISKLNVISRYLSLSSSLFASRQNARESEILNLPRKSVVFRTSKRDPAEFNETDIGLFYTIPMDKYNQIFQYGLDLKFQKQINAVNEAAFMVRRPFLELRDCLTRADYEQPARRYLIYGSPGAGKTMTLNSVIHYASSKGWIIVQMPWPLEWFYNYQRDKQTEISSWNDRRIDLPYVGADWLRNFRVQNAVILATRKDLVTTKTYKWTMREETPEGSHLNALIDFGLDRVRYSSDCIGAILRELRLLSTHCSRPTNILVSLDGINLFWTPTTLPRPDQSPKVFVPPDTVSLVHNFKKMLRSDWSGGAVVASVDADVVEDPWIMNRTKKPFDRKCVSPPEILGGEGFAAVEPFYPLRVPYFDRAEFLSAVEFYIDKRIIQLEAVKTEQGIMELDFVTNRSPGYLNYLSTVL